MKSVITRRSLLATSAAATFFPTVAAASPADDLAQAMAEVRAEMTRMTAYRAPGMNWTKEEAKRFKALTKQMVHLQRRMFK